MGEPTEEIEDPHAAHYLDAVRYIIGYANPDKKAAVVEYRSPVARPGRFPPERTLPPIIRDHHPSKGGWVAFPGLRNF
jgi:hypothetical protein